MTLASTITALKAATIALMACGLLFLLGAHPATAWPLAMLADLVFWPLDGAQSMAQGHTRLLAGIGGGVMLGWSVMLWRVVTRLMPADPRLARGIVTEAILVWFVTDSIASFLAGGGINVILNAGLLLLFLVPLFLASRTASAAA